MKKMKIRAIDLNEGDYLKVGGTSYMVRHLEWSKNSRHMEVDLLDMKGSSLQPLFDLWIPKNVWVNIRRPR